MNGDVRHGYLIIGVQLLLSTLMLGQEYSAKRMHDRSRISVRKLRILSQRSDGALSAQESGIESAPDQEETEPVSNR